MPIHELGLVLDYVALSDPSVIAAFWIGAVSIVLTLLLFVQVLWMRVTLISSEKNRDRFQKVWQPVFVRRISGENIKLPPLSPSDEIDFLHLWAHYHETLRGDIKSTLNKMLIDSKLDQSLISMLKKNSLDEQLISATCLGFLKSKSAWDDLNQLLNDASPVLTITIARSLVMIDPERARDKIIDLIINHRDWSATKLAVILKESDPIFLDAFFQHVTRDVDEMQPYLPRLLRLVDAIHPNYPLPFVRKLLSSTDNPELVSAGLRLVNDPSEMDLVRQRVHDTHWSVQVQVAAILGRLGTREDIPALLSLLDSREWWVRYRAGQALAKLPFLSRQNLEDIIANLKDNYARDILRQAIAEKSPS